MLDLEGRIVERVGILELRLYVGNSEEQIDYFDLKLDGVEIEVLDLELGICFALQITYSISLVALVALDSLDFDLLSFV